MHKNRFNSLVKKSNKRIEELMKAPWLCYMKDGYTIEDCDRFIFGDLKLRDELILSGDLIGAVGGFEIMIARKMKLKEYLISKQSQ